MEKGRRKRCPGCGRMFPIHETHLWLAISGEGKVIQLKGRSARKGKSGHHGNSRKGNLEGR